MHRLPVLGRRVRYLFSEILRELNLRFCRLKAILFALVRAFQFELAVPEEKIVKRSVIVQRPYLVDEDIPEMPMFITAYHRS
jgi:hypothetical protein